MDRIGTHDSLIKPSIFVKVIEKRQCLSIAEDEYGLYAWIDMPDVLFPLLDETL